VVGRMGEWVDEMRSIGLQDGGDVELRSGRHCCHGIPWL
jgi:hypothetical protein